MKFTLTFILAFFVCAASVSAQTLTWHAADRYITPDACREERVQTPLRTTRMARILFAGDLMQHLPQVESARQADGTFDYSASFEYIEPLFAEADLVVVNLETTLTRSSSYSGYPCFRSPAALAPALRRAGVDVCVLANNHCCDGGRDGLRTTQYELERAGIAHTGIFTDTTCCRVLRVCAAEVRLALLNYTYGTNGIPVPQGFDVAHIDTLRMAADLRCARRGSDCVAVYLHWGDEYVRKPNGQQRELVRFLRRHGADLIIGSHPHVVQSFETDASGAVFYSLGNFVSNQRRRYCDGGIVADVWLAVDARGKLTVDANAIPVWVDMPAYRILPCSVADTLPLAPLSRMLYERFVADLYSGPEYR